MGMKRVEIRCEVCGGWCRPVPPNRRCQTCKVTAAEKALIGAATAPALPPIPQHDGGDWCVIFDVHVPYHDPALLIRVCRIAERYRVKQLAVGGDLIHADIFGRFDKIGDVPSAMQEIQSTVQVLTALQTVFNRIVIIPGNHEQRIEKTIAKASSGGTKEMLDAMLGGEGKNPGELGASFLRHFFENDGITLHELPEMEINGWLIHHGKNFSRTPPQTERRIAHTKRISNMGGHAHVSTSYSFDDSGTDMCVHVGPLSDDSKFRYQREAPSHFPERVPGMVLLFDDGSAWPIALHERCVDPIALADRLGAK